MLKITHLPENGSGGSVLKVEGQVIGGAVDELRRVCLEVLGHNGGSRHGLELNLDGLSFLDTDGLALFRELARRRVTFTNCSVFIAEQLKEVADDRR